MEGREGGFGVGEGEDRRGGGEEGGLLCHTIAGFVKAVGGIAVRGEYYDGVA